MLLIYKSSLDVNKLYLLSTFISGSHSIYLSTSLPNLPRSQIQAYLDNVFDVAALLEDVEQKNLAFEARAEAEERLSVEKVRIE